MSGASPVVAVVQARMSSSRLPGKVLMPIAGKPLLWHIVHRLSQCRTIDKIAIATSTDPSDDAIAEFCAQESVICVRGSLTNVLDRYRLAAETTGAGTLLRVTGDTPLLDPGFVDYLVTALGEGDYAVLAPDVPCAHDGVDVFSRRALDWLTKHVADDPVAREHVTSYFKLHPDVINTVTVAAYAPLARPHERLSIDTADDLALIRALYERAGAAPGDLKLADALDFLRDQPDLRRINAHVRQKSIGQGERHALICCQGGHQAGLGHVRRSLSLARALRDEQGFGVTIAIHGDDSAVSTIRAASFEAMPINSAAALEELAGAKTFILAIVDVKDWLTRDDVAALGKTIARIAVIDDGSDRRLAATRAYYPPVPQARELSWEGTACRPQIGWEWSVLGFDPGRFAATPKTQGPLHIVVSMGGADPFNLTALAVEALQGVARDFHADIVIGPGFADPQSLTARIAKAGARFAALTQVSDLAGTFAGAELGLIAFGVTAYELAALGVPALYLPISADHARAASVFVSAGLGLLLPENPSPASISGAVDGLIGDPAQRRGMGEAGPRLVDGRGASRIAADLAAGG